MSNTTPISVLKTRKGRLEFAKTSLRSLTQLSILHNKKFFCDLSLRHPDPFSCISNPVKNEMLELAAKIHRESDKDSSDDEIDLQCKILQLLLNEDLVSFEFPPGVRKDGKSVTELWQRLVSVSPTNLQKTVRNCAVSLVDTWHVDPLFSHFLRFPNLQIINLESFSLDDYDLCNIVAHLKQLRVLEVNLEKGVSKKGISALAKLPNLRDFTFNGWGFANMEGWLSLCLRHVPHLHELGNRFNPRVHPLRTGSSFGCIAMLGLPMAQALSGLRKRCQIGLERLQLMFLTEIPKTVSFPNLKAFFVVEPKEAFQVDDRFSKVTELGLYGIKSQAECLRILGRLGHQLDKLYLLLESSLDVSKVLELCPKLSELHLYANEFVLSADLKPDTLSGLKDLKICLEEKSVNNIQSGLLLQLLEAPKLQTVEICSYNSLPLRPDQILQIVEEVKSKKILRKMHSFLLKGKVEDLPSDELPSHLSAHARLIMNCPRLHTVADWFLMKEITLQFGAVKLLAKRQ